MDVNYQNTLTLLSSLQRMVRKSDHWRGWVGWDDESPTDQQAEAMLDLAIQAVMGDAIRAELGE